MEKPALKDVLYGGISELMNNRKFYYRSEVGPQYSKWTEEGQTALIEHVVWMAQHIHITEDQALNKRAKELVIKGLKGENV